MKNKLHWKPSSLLAPVPAVMVSCGTLEKANIITVGWCGVLSTRPPRLYVSIRPERHSYGIIDSTGEFVVNLTPASLVEVVDYCGTVTGKKVDKAAKTGLTLTPSDLLDNTGKLHLERAGLLVYSHGEYFNIGKKLGKIGLSMENKKKGRKAKV